VNRADGISEIEGKAAMDSGERVGKRASFKSVVADQRLTQTPYKIPVNSWFNGGEADHLREIFHAKNSYFFTPVHRTP
jgi:hypothetical protein